jgi:holliday junction DNA helicase RuvA
MTIGYLKGTIINVTKNISNRFILLIEVNDIGYEVQVTPRLAQELTINEDKITIFTHLQIQEDRQILYGFVSATERDLFRQLISVSGIGTQLAIALLDTLTVSDLIVAVVSSNIPVLTKTPGVGKKTAERIALELKSKLAQWQDIAEIKVTIPNSNNVDVKFPQPAIREELEMTLLALAYTPQEIEQAITAISRDLQLQKNSHIEDWLRSAISWLTGE